MSAFTMFKQHKALVLSAVLLSTKAILAMPIEEPTIRLRDLNCAGGPGAPYDESCWGSLGLSDWLKNWNATAPKCAGADDGSSCCGPSNNPNEPWTTCFLRLALGNADYDCSQINAKSCSLEGFTLSSKANSSDQAELRYVVRNIYAINNLFSTWFTALQYATTQASLYSTAITTLVDPEKKTNVALTDILTALTAGLALLGAPEISAAIQATYKTVGSIVAIALQQAPGVAKAIWPEGTVDSQTVQIGNLDQALAGIDDQMSDMINAGLHEVMSDISSFLAFASTGHFSGSDTPSLPSQTQNLDLGLKTFVLTTAMKNNYWRGSWEVLPANGLGNWPNDRYKVYGFVAEQPNGIVDVNCKGCDGGNGDYAGWVSPSRWGWTMDQSNHKNSPDIRVMQENIVNNDWSDLGLIFDGGYNCTVAAQNGTAGKQLIKYGDDGSLDLSCLSQLPILMGCDGCPVAPTNGGTCQFLKWDGC